MSYFPDHKCAWAIHLLRLVIFRIFCVATSARSVLHHATCGEMGPRFNFFSFRSEAQSSTRDSTIRSDTLETLYVCLLNNGQPNLHKPNKPQPSKLLANPPLPTTSGLLSHHCAAPLSPYRHEELYVLLRSEARRSHTDHTS